eukprot:m.216645 g.216645  ORF g.216645 m.216645 type:complete len:159 (-) comp15548_c0_seq2:67-543(-)
MFTSISPTNKPTPLPCCLQFSAEPTPNNPGKVDVYRCEAGNPSQTFEVDPQSGVISAINGTACLAGRAAYNPPAPGVAGVQLWAKPLSGNRVAALFINGGQIAFPGTTIPMAELNVTGTAVTVQDVWTGEDAGAVANGQWMTGEVPPLDSRFVVFTSK